MAGGFPLIENKKQLSIVLVPLIENYPFLISCLFIDIDSIFNVFKKVVTRISRIVRHASFPKLLNSWISRFLSIIFCFR